MVDGYRPDVRSSGANRRRGDRAGPAEVLSGRDYHIKRITVAIAWPDIVACNNVNVSIRAEVLVVEHLAGSSGRRKRRSLPEILIRDID